ncbi:ABC transporter permease [Streptomyces sp. SID3343]|uniref:ABC transporter permease n=1 Tax=Streptomyces sp. SID3343 TaxID=2690260 RepID=UPI00136BACA9|nr:ABC transporter permease [Streptomyces sp. SID3343]MYW02004.1 FtsX-like permease family protein [Streptomyces sp. SID3343]
MTTGLARASIRSRPSAFVGTFVAAFFSAALIVAAGTLLGAATGAKPPLHRYERAPVLVAESPRTDDDPLPDRPRVDARLTERLARLPTVDRAVPDTTFPVTITRPATITDRGARTHPAARTEPDPIAHPDPRPRPLPLPATGQPAASIALFAPDPAMLVGRAPGPGEVVLDAATARTLRVAPGDRVTLTTSAGTAAYALSGTLDASTRTGTAAWFADRDADALSGHPGRVDAIALLPKPGTAPATLRQQVRATLAEARTEAQTQTRTQTRAAPPPAPAAAPPPAAGTPAHPGTEAPVETGTAHVFTGSARAELENPQHTRTKAGMVSICIVIGGTCLYISLFVVATTMSLSIAQRQRETALLRGIGARPGHIRRMVAAEAVLVSLLAVATAYLPGLWLAHRMFASMADHDLVPEGARLGYGLIPVLVALGASLFAAVPGSLLASHRAARSRPAEALGESLVPRRGIGPFRALLGLIATAGGVFLTVGVLADGGPTANKAAPFAILLFLVAVSLLGPLLARVVTELSSLPLRLLGAGAELATQHGRARSRRLSSAIVPVALVVAFGCVKLGMSTTMAHEAKAEGRAALVADRVVRAPGGLPPTLVHEVAGVSGVTAAVGLDDVPVLIGADGRDPRPGDDEVSGRAFAGTDLPSVLDPRVRAGRLGDVRPAALGAPADAAGTVALSARLAERAGVTVGQRVRIRLGDGMPIAPTVAAIHDLGLGVGDVLLPRATLAGHTTSPMTDTVLIRIAPDADRAGVDRALTAALAPVPGAQLRSADAFEAAQDRSLDESTWLETAALSVIAGFAAIAAANTLVMITFERLREVSMLRLIGARRRTIRRMVRVEALLVGLTGLLVGAGVSLTVLVPLVRDATRRDLPYLPPVLIVSIVAGVVVLVLATTALPLSRLLRVRPMEGVGRRA